MSVSPLKPQGSSRSRIPLTPKKEESLPGGTPKKAVIAPLPYHAYKSIEEIDYTPENAIAQGLGMIQALKASIDKLELESKLRREVWVREI